MNLNLFPFLFQILIPVSGYLSINNYWYNISYYQNLSETFIIEFANKLQNWKYIYSLEEQRNMISEKYEIVTNKCDEEFVICYKTVREDYSSIFDGKSYDYNVIGKKFNLAHKLDGAPCNC